MSDRPGDSDAESRGAFMAEAATLLAGSPNYQETLDMLAHVAVPRLADWCAIDEVDEAGHVRRISVAHPDPARERLAREMEERYPPDPDAPFGVPAVLRTGEAELVPEIPEELLAGAARDEEHARIIAELGLRSYMVVPLRARGRMLGAISFVSAESGRRFGPDDLSLAQELADRAALAVDNARLLRDAEAAHRQTEQILESIPQLVWVTRPDGYHDYYNQRWYDYTGLSPADTEGAGWNAVLHPEDQERAWARWRHSLASGEPYTIEYRFRRHDGAYRWFLGQALPQRDAEGRIVRWFGTLTDIHDRRQADAELARLIAELERERARLAELFREAPAFIAVLRGPEHRFEMANPPYLQLVGHREVVGRTVVEALPEVVEQGFVGILDGVFRSGEPFVGSELRVDLQLTPGAEPEPRYLNFVYQPLRESDGAVSGIFVHGVDVTVQVRAREEVERKAGELARLAEALEASNRELDQFAYVASHDLKAPLRGIANLSQWIEEDLEPAGISAETREHLELLRGRVHRMEGLIDGILQYSRAGRVRERMEAVDTGALVAEVLDLLDPPEAVRIVVEPAMPTVRAERLPLQQVFLNLVGNAVKYARVERPEIRVGHVERPGEWEFSVADNGPGIAPEYHDRIFGIFQTLHPRDEVEGTGIGLSLVRKIVESRGGRVRVESEEGRGATFRFTIPRDADGGAA